jgi:hypothetical protein
VLHFCRSLTPTSDEQAVFDSLLEKRNSEPSLKPVTMRVVGGWVRDKLLSRSPGDMDVCLSNVTGRFFASSVGAKFHLVAENPAKSKHLETAIVRAGPKGQAVDLSHLRTERYVSNSRIPFVEFGTLAEDALRRDCTINALYYNLDTREVEDPTGRGLADLDAGVIRAPTVALTTLCDDPLRLLRVVRFSSLLGFALDEELLEGFSNRDVLEGLETKVSRERVNIEMDKILLLHRDACATAVSVFSGVEGLMDIIFWRRKQWSPNLEARVVCGDVVESLATSSDMLLALRSAALLAPVQEEEPDLRMLFLERLKWSRLRSSNVLRVLNGMQRLDVVGTDWVELALWARGVGQGWWEAVIELARFLSNEKRKQLEWAQAVQAIKNGPLSERVFLPTVLNGEEVARSKGLQNMAIGLALEDLTRWQMNATSVTKEAALEYLQQRIY